MSTDNSLRAALRLGAEQLQQASRQPQRDAALLLCHALGKDRGWLLAHAGSPLDGADRDRFFALVERRTRHEPMQYIRGEQEFYGLRLLVTPAVLIPRPETELLVEQVLARLPHDRPLRIADVGTGSGAIAVALAHHLPPAQIDALDLSPAALAVARQNAELHGVSQRVHCLHSDLLAAVRGRRYDAVVSNPPYVSTHEALEPQVAGWEPHDALFAGEDGLAIYRRLLPQAADALLPGGLLAIELGYGQEAALRALFTADPRWTQYTTYTDLRGIPRTAVACRADRP